MKLRLFSKSDFFRACVYVVTACGIMEAMEQVSPAVKVATVFCFTPFSRSTILKTCRAQELLRRVDEYYLFFLFCNYFLHES